MTVTYRDNVANGFKQPNALGNNPPFLNGVNAAMLFNFTITAGAPSSNICDIAIALQDGYGGQITQAPIFSVWLSDAATGIGLTATTASGTVTNKSASGVVFAADVAKKFLRVQPLATGIFTLEITDTAKTGFYIACQNPFTGQVTVSRQLTSADYG